MLGRMESQNQGFVGAIMNLSGVPLRLKWCYSELILCYTILSGSHVGFPKVGTVCTRATHAVGARMIQMPRVASGVQEAMHNGVWTNFVSPCHHLFIFIYYFINRWFITSSWDGVSLKTPRPRGWVRAGRPSGGESSFNKRNMYQYPHVSQLFILTSLAKPGIPGAIKIGWVCTADYRMLLGTAVQPVLAWKNGR